MATLDRLSFGLLVEQEIGRGVARDDKIVVVIEFLNACRFLHLVVARQILLDTVRGEFMYAVLYV